MIAALRKHSGIGAAATGESNAQEGSKRREGWDSQRGSIQYIPMLGAMKGLVKRYYARPGYFNDSAGSHSNRCSSPLDNAF
jgi:hypothetical protein